MHPKDFSWKTLAMNLLLTFCLPIILIWCSFPIVYSVDLAGSSDWTDCLSGFATGRLAVLEFLLSKPGRRRELAPISRNRLTENRDQAR
jgi:hypothetical protein